MARELSQFVRHGLMAGHDRGALKLAMLDAGWSDSEIDQALSEWAETPFTPPVPRPGKILSVRDIFIYALITVALAVVAINLVEFAHRLIDRAFLETSQSVTNPLSLLVIFAPLFVILQRREGRSRRADPARDRSLARICTVYLVLFVAASVLLLELSFLVNAVLNDGLSMPFALKTLVVFVVGAVVFLGYLPRNTK